MKKKMPRVFIDKDGVLADFNGLKVALGVDGDTMKEMPGAFAQLKPIPGALAAVRSIIGMGYRVHIATKPPTGLPHAYADKADWILRHLPELKRNIIITHDKGLLGNEHDFLIDDRPHKANCEEFPGTLIHFRGDHDWPRVLAILTAHAKRLKAEPVAA